AAIDAIADAVETEKEALGRLLSSEQGKPARTAAMGEMNAAIMWIRATAKLRPAIETIKDDDTGLVQVHRLPLGVVGSITPWNRPVLTAVWHIMPGLPVGHAVVIKPASYTPLSTLRLVEIASRHLPAGVLNVVTGEGA